MVIVQTARAQPSASPGGGQNPVAPPTSENILSGPSNIPAGAPEPSAPATGVKLSGPKAVPGSSQSVTDLQAKEGIVSPLFIILPLAFLLTLALAIYFIHRRGQIK